MTKNPLINALTSSLYIVLVVIIMFYGVENNTTSGKTIAIPIAVLSLFTLSAAVMAYLFFYQPLLLLLDGKKKEALNLFLRTVGVFAVITSIAMGLLLTGLI